MDSKKKHGSCFQMHVTHTANDEVSSYTTHKNYNLKCYKIKNL